MAVAKSYGYFELRLSEGVVPCKISMFSLQMFCEQYGVKFQDIHTVIEEQTGKDANGKIVKATIPVDIYKFFGSLLWASASYVRKTQGYPFYNIEDAYEWIVELGIDSKVLVDIMVCFMLAIANGGKVPDIKLDENGEMINPDANKKKEVSEKNLDLPILET